MSDLIQASLAEIRARLAGGDVSAEAVAKACLDRIAETEPSIHALITVREQALEEARALDAQGPDVQTCNPGLLYFSIARTCPLARSTTWI